MSTRAAALAVVVAALVSAGCLEGRTDGEEPRPSVVQVEQRVKVADLRNAQSEAFVQSTPDGQTLLTCLHGEFQEPSLMYASTDAGATWRELTASPTPVTGGDCEVALTDDGGWHFVHTQAAGITVASTYDEGASWRVDRLAGPPVTTFSDRPWLEPSGDSLVLTYDGYAGLVGRVSPDAGASWSLPQVIVQPLPAHLVISGHLKVGRGPERALAVAPYLQVAAAEAGEGTPRQVTLGIAVSTDLGATWDDRSFPAVQALPVHPAAAIGADGSIHVSYFEPAGEGYDLVARSTSDAGVTWSGPWTVLAGLQRPARAWADAGPDGTVDFLVTDTNATFGLPGDGPAIALLRVDPAHPTAELHPVVVGHDHNEFSTLAHDGAGRALLVFTEGGGGVGMGATPGSALWFVRET